MNYFRLFLNMSSKILASKGRPPSQMICNFKVINFRPENHNFHLVLQALLDLALVDTKHRDLQSMPVSQLETMLR